MDDVSSPEHISSNHTSKPNGATRNVNRPSSRLRTFLPNIFKAKKTSIFSSRKGRGISLTASSKDSVLSSESLAKKKGIRSQLNYKKSLFVPMSGQNHHKDDSEPLEQRFITKNGFLHIHYVNNPGLNQKVLKDLFHTIMDAKWRYFALLFTMSFLISWLIFAAIWFIIAKARTENCVDNVNSFTTAFLFSVETQVTIGYGGRAVTDECPEGVILLIVQTIIGTFINCALLGLLFAKLSRPKNRGKTIVFSKKAVITLRDGRYCLIFRYVDLRERKLLDSNMRLVLIKPRLTDEGEYVPLDMNDLGITIDYNQVEFTLRLFPIYPVNIIHVIDEDSPLYEMSKSNLENAKFELIAVLEGTVPGTGNTTQAITSYKPREILWSSRFEPVFLGLRHGKTNSNCIDLSVLDVTCDENTTPKYSAKDHDCQKKENESSSSSDSDSDKDMKSISDDQNTSMQGSDCSIQKDQKGSMNSLMNSLLDSCINIDPSRIIDAKESMA